MKITENDYKISRDKINKAIKHAAGEIQGELEKVVLARTEILINLINEWNDYYSDKIRGMSQVLTLPDDPTKIISKAYTEYFSYTFAYRILHNNVDNILYTKIISFELHFFRKYNIFSLNQSIKWPNDPDRDETLFYYDPLGHFTYYKLQKEYHLTRKISPVKGKDLFDRLLNRLLSSMTDFFFRL